MGVWSDRYASIVAQLRNASDPSRYLTVSAADAIERLARELDSIRNVCTGSGRGDAAR